MRVLLVEDDNSIARSIAESLTDEGFIVVRAPTGEEAFFLLNTETFDLVLLDWMLPGRSGLEILRSVRERGLDIPVLMLTARDEVKQRQHRVLYQRQTSGRLEVGTVLLVSGVRCVVRRDDVQATIVDGLDQCSAVFRSFDGRVALDARAELIVTRLIKPQVVYADLGSDALLAAVRRFE